MDSPDTDQVKPDLRTRVNRFAARFKLDSHHAMERFGVLVGCLALVGVLILGVSGVQAIRSNSEQIDSTAVWTKTFTTSKTKMSGTVDGVYRNRLGNKVMVLMHFDPEAKIDYNADNYKAFLLGSDTDLNVEPVSTTGVKGTFEVFGSTGYVGVLLEATQPFKQQVLNLTVRAGSELTTSDDTTDPSDQNAALQADDPSFTKHDQWRIFLNPAASTVKYASSLDRVRLDPSDLYYQTVLAAKEKAARATLDKKLLALRADRVQIDSYTHQLVTTKVDGLFLEPPKVPAVIDGDQVTGRSSAENGGGAATLTLHSRKTVAGGLDFDWRNGSVEKGYLDQVVPKGQSYVDYLAKLARATDTSTDSTDIGNITWKLSNGTSLSEDYDFSDTTMRPLTSLMEKLSAAYESYSSDKIEYQTTDLQALLNLDIDLRDVAANSSTRTGSGFLTVY